MANCANGIADVTVLAPNKKKSNLFDRILRTFTGDKDSAYKTFLGTKTEGFQDWAKDIPKDNNGEPAVRYNRETHAFEVQDINKEKLADLKEASNIESIIGKLGIFDTYFRDGDNSNLSEALSKPIFNLTSQEVSYIMSIGKSGEQISSALGARYGKLLNNDKVLNRIKQLKQLEYDQALDDNLVKFAKSIGVTVEVVQNLKEKFGVNAAGVADILNKIIYVSKDRKLDTMAEEIGHFYSELMGYKDGVGKQLYQSVLNWPGYKEVLDKYSTIYTNLDGSPDMDKIRKEAIGQAIAEAIIKNYAVTSDKIPAADRAFWKIVVEAIRKAVGLFKSLSYRNIDLLTDDIAKKILTNDNSDIITRLKETTEKNQQLKTYDESLADFPDARRVINTMRDAFNGILTGSLALRFHGTIYRNESETIHDLDFSVPYTSWNGDEEAFKKLVEEQFPDILWVNEKPFTSVNNLTYNAIITNKPELVERFRALTGNFNSRLENFTYEEQQEMLLIDLFLMHEGIEIGHVNNLQNADVIFNAKSSIGMRPKDSFDLLNYIPYTKSPGLSSYSYFQATTPDDELIEAALEQFDLKNDKAVVRLTSLVASQIDALNKRVKDYKKSVNSLKGVDKTERQASITKLEDLLEQLNTLETKEQFLAIVDYTQQEMERIEKWLEGGAKGFDPTKEKHRDTLLAINRQLDTYKNLDVPEFAVKHSQLRDTIDTINKQYKNINESLREAVQDVILKMHQQYSTNENYKEKEALEEYLREGKDIDGLQALLIDLNSSSNTTLGLVGKIYAEKGQEIMDYIKVFTKEVNAAGRKLLLAGYANQEFMVDKTTGNIITRLSSAWKETLNKVMSVTDSLEVGDNGMKIKREYIKKPLDELLDDEKQHNLTLSEDKKQIADFLKPEKWDKAKGSLVDGQNKKYTDEFKDARSDNEVYENGGWTKSAGVTQEEYNKYLKKYYEPTQKVWRLVTEEVFTEEDQGNGKTRTVRSFEKTGEVEEVDVRFVKDTYTEVQTKWNSKEYDAIQGNAAQKEFYDYYVKTFKELLDKLPADVAKRMDGRVLRIRGEFIAELASKKTSIIKTVLKKLKQLILPDIITNGRQLDEQGFAVSDIGIFYAGDLKSEKRILQLESMIEGLKNAQDPASKKQLIKLRNSLLIENQKLEPKDLKYDLVESLIQGMAMAENYDVMKSVESSFLLTQQHLNGKKFWKGTDKGGDPLTDSQGNIEYKTETSKVEQRLETWLRMIFYNNSQANNSQIGAIAGLMKRMTSITLQGLNVFSAVNNVITAEGNQIIEGFGGRFYKNPNYHKASMEMAKHLADGRWASHMFKQPDKYTEEKPFNKLTAIVEYFNFLEEHSDRGGGIKQKQTPVQYAKSFNWMYALIEGGEYQAQTRSAMAMLDATEITKEDGTKLSLFDAIQFDEATKKLTFVDGVTFSAKDKYNMTGKIKNMNKYIHGNYSSADKVAIQENWYGELAFQFKKWIPNNVRSRFSNSYYDESLGMWQQGRYKAATRMLENITELSFAGVHAGYKALTDLEQANMRKNIAEVGLYATAIALYIIFDAIREGLPPDDEKSRMALNFLKKQADRSRGEIDQFLNPLQWYAQAKNPVAGLSILKEGGEFIGAVAGIPFHALQGKPEKNRYEKGINKGELKVWKEFKDLIPGLRTLSAWDQLEVNGNFFIK